MCLSIPAKIIKISGDEALVSVGGALRNANLGLIENPKIGEFVLLHAGFAISKIAQKEAMETLKLLTEFESFSYRHKNENN